MGKRLQWTESQHKRLVELDADAATLARTFDDTVERNRAFQVWEKKRVGAQRDHLEALRNGARRPRLCRLENALVEKLVAEGFVQVSTPVLMSKGLLAKMAITGDHPLGEQVYWVAKDKCLRPMLAPHLYYLMKDLLRLWATPVRIFEVGPCFRKETEGARHAAEFTMLNLCEFGLPEKERQPRLEQLAAMVVEVAGIENYALAPENSTVYGATLDIISTDTDMELGSGAMGPHPLDRAWRIADTWVGIGFGLERLLMASQGGRNLARYGRSITYLDGVRLNI